MSSHVSVKEASSSLSVSEQRVRTLCRNGAIKANKIGGAAIDVFETEPATNNVLFGLENVLLTPHISASTSEAQIIVAEMVANQFVEYFLNNKVINAVTL